MMNLCVWALDVCSWMSFFLRESDDCCIGGFVKSCKKSIGLVSYWVVEKYVMYKYEVIGLLTHKLMFLD